MISECRRRGHNVVERAGYVICMELGCSDRAIKLPHAQPNNGDKYALVRKKKQHRRHERIEDWETFEPSMWLDEMTHWMSNPYRRWWQHILCVPAYLVCVLIIIVLQFGS